MVQLIWLDIIKIPKVVVSKAASACCLLGFQGDWNTYRLCFFLFSLFPISALTPTLFTLPTLQLIPQSIKSDIRQSVRCWGQFLSLVSGEGAGERIGRIKFERKARTGCFYKKRVLDSGRSRRLPGVGNGLGEGLPEPQGRVKSALHVRWEVFHPPMHS